MVSTTTFSPSAFLYVASGKYVAKTCNGNKLKHTPHGKSVSDIPECPRS